MVGKIVRLAVVLLVKLPIALLAYLAFNLARIVAPSLLVNFIKGSSARQKMQPVKMMDSIKSTEDIGFMFSLDKVKVILKTKDDVKKAKKLRNFDVRDVL